MESWALEAMEKAYANSSIDEITEAIKHAARFKSVGARENVEFLKRLLEQRLAEEEKQPSASEWSKSQEPKKKPLTPEEKEAQREKELRRLSNNGQCIPFVTPESPWKNQLEYQQFQNMTTTSIPPISPYACLECQPVKKSPSCCGACESPTFWHARRIAGAAEKLRN